MPKVTCYQRGASIKYVSVPNGATCRVLLKALNINNKDARVLLVDGEHRNVISWNESIAQNLNGWNAFIMLPPSVQDNSDLPKTQPDFKIDKRSITRFTQHLPSPSEKPERTGGLTQMKKPASQELFEALVPTLIAHAKTIQRGLGVAVESDVSSQHEAQTNDDNEEAIDDEDTPYDPLQEVNREALSQVMAVGFEQNHAIRALLGCSMNPEQAIVWLLEHQGDPSLDRPITPPPKPIKKSLGRKFVPDPQCFRKLKEMGFSEEDVLAALQLTRNKFDLSCELLINQDDVQARLKQQQCTQRYPNPHLLRKLLENELVLSAMRKPEFIKALELLVSDPANHTAISYAKTISFGIDAIFEIVARFRPEYYLDEDTQAEFPNDGLDNLVNESEDYHGFLINSLRHFEASLRRMYRVGADGDVQNENEEEQEHGQVDEVDFDENEMFEPNLLLGDEDEDGPDIDDDEDDATVTFHQEFVDFVRDDDENEDSDNPFDSTM